MQQTFDLEGHRGCRGLMPENTVAAMLHALDLGVTTLEMDASITRDSQVILSHEPFFNHEISTRPDGTRFEANEDGKYNIYLMDYAEVAKWDVGLKPNPRFPEQKKQPAVKPRLGDLIDSVENYIRQHKLRPVDYNIETKCLPGTDHKYHPEPSKFVQLLMDVIQSKKIESRVIIQSFDIRTLKIIHAQFPGIRTSLLIEDFDKREIATQIAELGFRPAIYSPAYQLVTRELVEYCHSNGMKIIPWTINEKKIFDEQKRLGVDGIITDYPNVIK
jgi:glycerophosphoryl diester phosphodiesterase